MRNSHSPWSYLDMLPVASHGPGPRAIVGLNWLIILDALERVEWLELYAFGNKSYLEDTNVLVPEGLNLSFLQSEGF